MADLIKLDYRPRQNTDFRQWVYARRRQIGCGVPVLAILLFLFLTMFVLEDPRHARLRERKGEEKVFYQLAELAHMMIQARAPGTVTDGDTTWIVSFDEFIRFAATHDTNIAAADSTNPLGSLLPRARYTFDQSTTNRSDDPLIWGNEVYNTVVGEMQYVLRRDGQLQMFESEKVRGKQSR
jgi:hypothetical protein